jgi:hypothetical protein
MPFIAVALTLLAFSWASVAAASAAEPKQPLFAALGIETVEGRQGAIAAPLPDGRVLIAGGADNVALRSAEIFDPIEYDFEPVPHLTRYKRVRAMAAPLPDGRVLIAGGSNEVTYAHAEIFDPETEEFSDVEDEMTTKRRDGVAAALPDGRVLIAGGSTGDETASTAEVFDPTNETFAALSQRMARGRRSAVGVALPSGKVLIAGGYEGNNLVRSVEVFDPATETFTLINSSMPQGQSLATAAALPNGQVMIAGGVSGGIPRRWAGLLDSESGVFSYLPKEGGTQLTTERADAIAIPIADGKVLISGGSWPEARSSAEIFVPGSAIGATGTALGNHVLGRDSVPATVSLTSLGGWDLEIDAVSLAGQDAADFEILADSCTGVTLDFEESCALSVRFSPTRPGDAEAPLIIDDNEPTPTDVTLTATGVAPFVPSLSEPSALPSPAVNPPLSQPKPRRSRSVRCTVRPARHSKWVKVICRVTLGSGAWGGRLLHRGRTVARRRVDGGFRRLVFRPIRRKRGGYRLELAPLPR